MRRLLWDCFIFRAQYRGSSAPCWGGCRGAPEPQSNCFFVRFSNNSASASASNGPFNITVDILPEHTPGFVRVTAAHRKDQPVSPLHRSYCAYQPVSAESGAVPINFTTECLWSIRADYSLSTKATSTQIFAVTVLRVGS